MAFRDYFSSQSRQYSAFRPTYPADLAAFLAAIAPSRALAWDCGTGQGQAARMLATEFDRVVATDASAEQLSGAEPHPRIEFRVADAAQSGLDAATCDLVTSAQAAHWFDLPAFYAEARRVLRPGGVIGIWCYVALEMDDHAIAEYVHVFQHTRLEDYWPPGRELVDACYTTMPFPFARLSAPRFEIRARWNRAGMMGYASSWSATVRCRAAEGVDPLPEFEAGLRPLWPDPEDVKEVRWPLYLLVGRRD